MNSTELKYGFTTGTCAQAAAKGASLMLLTRKLIEEIEVETPAGKKLVLRLIGQKIGKNFASCGVRKDSGDDPDVTNGAVIYAEVRFSVKKGVTVFGGEGVGRVIKPGLAVAVGESAINPVPRKMIIKEVSRYWPRERGLAVVIGVPGGEELAKQTFNPRLGIVGGLSIIGTTGIVVPRSTEAYQASLALQLRMLKAAGGEKAALVLGYVGERAAKAAFKFDSDSIIKIGDHVGFMLKECVREKIKEVFLIGHIGKLVKIAAGQWDTHSQYGDNRLQTIARFAAICGAKKKVIEELKEQTTAEATLDILRGNGLAGVFEKIAEQIVATINEFLAGQININCVLLSLKGEILAAHPKNE